MVDFSKEERDGVLVLKVRGGLTIQEASDLKATLADALTRAPSVEVDLSALTSADLSCLQLFCSAHKTSGAEGRQLTISSASPAFRKAAAAAGYHRLGGCVGQTAGPCIFGEG